MCIGIVGVEIDELSVFVRLLVLDEFIVFIQCVVFAFRVFEQEVTLCLVVVILFAEHTVVDEYLDVVPLLLELFAFILEDACQTVAYLLRDVGADFLHVGIALEVASAHVQGNVRRVDNTVQQRQELGHNAFYGVGHEDLVAIELYLVALDVEVVLYLREVEDAGQVEGVIHIEVNPEERFVGHREEVTVELLVVLVLQVGGLLCPKRLYIVYYIVFVGIHLLAVLPFSLLAKSNGNGQEVAVLAQEAFYLVLLEELLAVVVDVHHDVCAALCLLHFFQREAWAAVATPFHGGSILIALRDDVNLFADHERAVEAKAEVTDDGVCVVLVLVQEVVGSGEGNLVDVLLNFVGSHTDAVIADGDGLGVFVDADANL